jgi:hypothetical protein
VTDRSVGPDKPRQSIVFHAFDGASLAGILGLPDPLFVGPGDPRRQLGYVEKYIRDLGCETVVLEQHYIDRDYMEDHSVFYAKSLRQYRNSCQRLHFFSLDKTKLRVEIRRLRGLALDAKLSDGEFKRECAQFSRQAYLGFSVIKPLPGCPVGRTVLRCLPAESGKGHRRYLDSASDSEVHLLGVPLTVRGLAFQQQDRGVSACATTALWTSLQKARQLEQAGFVTPAHITIRASQFALPFGRAMPSEGLSLDQMCQAVQSFGYSPTLYRADSSEVARALLQSSISSGICPVLVMSLGKDVRHAVAVAGTALREPLQLPGAAEIRHASADLVALYIHDDRCGPYLKAILPSGGNTLLIKLPLEEQNWTLTHILIPIHSKIRLSFRELYTAGVKMVSEVQGFLEERLAVREPSAAWSTRIVRSPAYIDSLLRDSRTAGLVDRICESVPFPRYLGAVHVEVPSFDPFDVLLDTTSTERNLNCSAVVQFGKSNPGTSSICQFIAARYRCGAF